MNLRDLYSPSCLKIKKGLNLMQSENQGYIFSIEFLRKFSWHRAQWGLSGCHQTKINFLIFIFSISSLSSIYLLVYVSFQQAALPLLNMSSVNFVLFTFFLSIPFRIETEVTFINLRSDLCS